MCNALVINRFVFFISSEKLLGKHKYYDGMVTIFNSSLWKILEGFE